MDNKVHLRVHHPNAILSVGLQNYNPMEKYVPTVLSAWGLGGVKKDDFSVFGGLHSAFNTTAKLVPFVGLLLGFKHKKFTGYLDYNCSRTTTKPVVLDKDGKELKTEEAKEDEQPEEKGKKVYSSHDVKLMFDSKVNNDLLVFGEATTDLTSLKSLVVGGEYNLGGNTKIRAKVF
jgi:hypothetical protein